MHSMSDSITVSNESKDKSSIETLYFKGSMLFKTNSLQFHLTENQLPESHFPSDLIRPDRASKINIIIEIIIEFNIYFMYHIY